MRAAAFAVAYLACVAQGQPGETQDAFESSRSLASLLVGLHPEAAEAAFNPSMMHPTIAAHQHVAQPVQPVMSGHKLWPRGQKTSKSMRKRFKPTSTGKLLFHQAMRGHLLRKKRPERKQRLRQVRTMHDGQLKTYTDNFKVVRWHKRRLGKPKPIDFEGTADAGPKITKSSVRFATYDEATKAIDEMYNSEVKGNVIKVLRNSRRDTVVNVWNLPEDMTHDEVKEAFSKVGTVKYVSTNGAYIGA